MVAEKYKDYEPGTQVSLYLKNQIKPNETMSPLLNIFSGCSLLVFGLCSIYCPYSTPVGNPELCSGAV